MLKLCSYRQLRQSDIFQFRYLANGKAGQIDINCSSDHKGRTPLQLLCRFHYENESFLRCLDELLKQNELDVSLKDFEGNTALHSLCFNGHNAVVAVIGRFLRRNIDINVRNKNGFNVLHCLIGQSVNGCGENLVVVIRYLIENGLDVQAKTNSEDTILTLLCDTPTRTDFMESLRFLVTELQMDVNHKNLAGFSALHSLCLRSFGCHQFVTAFRFFIESGADVKATTVNGDTILSLLLRHSCHPDLLKIVRFLVTEHQLDVFQTNGQGETVLHCLCANEMDESQIFSQVFQFLVEKGVDLEATTNNGVDTAYSYLCRNKRPTFDLLALLINHQGIDIQSRDSEGNNGLHQICRLNSKRQWLRENLECIRLLIDAGIDVNSKANNGVDNALHILCRAKSLNNLLPPVNSIQVVGLLIEKGIDVMARDVNRDTALHLICRHSVSKVLGSLVRLLVEAGVDVAARDGNGLTSVNILWSRRMELGSIAPEVIDYLINN